MNVETKGHTAVVRDSQQGFEALCDKINQGYANFESLNLIVDLSGYDKVTPADLKAFLPLAKSHKKARKSLVIVAPNFDFDKASDKLNVVPTLLEANDLIEMDEIERDLGF